MNQAPTTVDSEKGGHPHSPHGVGCSAGIVAGVGGRERGHGEQQRELVQRTYCHPWEKDAFSFTKK